MRKFANWYMRRFSVRSGIAHEMGGWIIGLVVALFILASLIPSAITSLSTADTSGWATNVISIWNILPIVVIAVVLLVVYARAKGSKA